MAPSKTYNEQMSLVLDTAKTHSSHTLAFALIAFEERFGGELTSRWQRLEWETHSAIVSAPLMQKHKHFQKFFDDAEHVVAEPIQEYFQRLLDVASKGSAQSLGNDSPLDWTKRHVLTELCEFLGLDPGFVKWAGSQNPQCEMFWHADPGFHTTSEPRQDSRVLRSAIRLTETKWLENEDCSEFLLPRWTETPHPAWALRPPHDSPEATSARDAEFEAKRMSRAETMRWVRHKEFSLSMNIALQIYKDSLEGQIDAGRTGISILETFTAETPENGRNGSTRSSRRSSKIDERKTLIGQLKYKYPHALAREICRHIDDRIEHLSSRLSKGAHALAPLVSWTKRASGIRRWEDLYKDRRTHRVVKTYINKIPALKTR